MSAPAKVWIRNPKADDEDVYLLGSVVGEADGTDVTVKMDKGGNATVDREQVFTANPDGFTCPDNTMLIHLSEATLLANVRQRFGSKEIYTLTGSILLAMNPFENLPIYGEKLMAPHKDKRLGAAGPHVYGIAETAYQRLRKTRKSQSIVVSGESGAGKTETNKHLMQYLAWRSRSGGGVDTLAEAILQSNPVLEAFGNAKTSRNNNSSRFGKFVKILMEDKGAICGAKMASYLLEKSRVVKVAEGERNYHVLYHLSAGASSGQLSSLGLSGGPKSFYYLNQSSVTSMAIMPDDKMFQEFSSASTACGINPDQQSQLYSALAGILHLGNLQFEGDEESKIKGGADSIKGVTNGFGADLSKCLIARTMKVGMETTTVPLSPEKAAYGRDALAKAIYVRLFEWVVSAVNRTLAISDKGGAGDPMFVGLLDVFGFEFFGTNNSFEQLAINFANEKLQQFFLKFVFQSEEDEYRVENVRYTPVEYQDNQGCIELIEKTPSGILRILDTQCKTPKASDETFSVQVNKEHKKHDFFLTPRAAGAATKKFKEEEAFVVRHFAGNVCYMSAGFMDKNNDTLNADFETALGASSNGLMASLFASADAGKGAKKGASFNSVGRKFINDLDSLMTDLGATHAHFIRCLKPNLKLAPQQVTPSLVLSQLRCSGTLEAVQLISASYPTRIPYEDIYGRYKEHMPDFVQKLEPQYFTEAIALACDVDENDFQLGRSKIFCRPGKGAFLEELKDRDLTEVIPILVAKIKEWEIKKQARARLARSVGGWAFRKLFLKQRKAANAIGHVHRGRKIRAAYEKKRIENAKRREEMMKKLAEERAKKAAEEAEARIRAAKGEEEKKKMKAEADKAAAEAAAKRSAVEKEQAAKKEAAKKAAAEREAARKEANKNKKAKSSGALLMGKEGGNGGADAGKAVKEKVPIKVKEDTYFVAKITKSKANPGLGIELDQVDGQAVIGFVIPRGNAATQTPIRAGDVVTKVYEYDTPTYDSALASIKGAGGTSLEMTMLRKPIKTVHRAECEMYLGGGAKSSTWRGVTIEITSNREIKYDTSKYPGVATTGALPMRDASEVQLRDKPEGNCSCTIVTEKKSGEKANFELRSKDGTVLHRLLRRLTPMFPKINTSIRHEGWLQKKAETGSTYSKRWCVLDSTAKMYYFKGQNEAKEQGVVDLSVATGVEDLKNGTGFSIATPGRDWVFKVGDKAEQGIWMASVTAMLNDLREIKKEQEAADGSSTLKASYAAMTDDIEIYDWKERQWWELTSTGELRISDGEGGALVRLVKLETITKVDRPKGEDYYTFCINIDVESVPGDGGPGEDYTMTMKPNGRSEMNSWLAILKEQVKKYEKTVTSGSGSCAVIQSGWMHLKRQEVDATAVQATQDQGRHFFALVSEQKEVAGTISVSNTLYWFDTEEQSSDLGSGSALDLEEVESVGVPGERGLVRRLSASLLSPRGSNAASTAANAIVLKITDSSWQLELTPEGEGLKVQIDWRTAFRHHCIHAEGYEEPIATGAAAASATKAAATSSNAKLSCELKMVVPFGGAGVHAAAGWRIYECELMPSGALQYKLSKQEKKAVPDGWSSGAIDVTRAIGVWLLGTEQSPTLDVILGKKKYTFAATTDGQSGNPSKATLVKWRDGISDMMPYKPVQELHKGWLDKKGEAQNAGWKSRYFVLLSTRRLMYYESETSGKPRGTVELQNCIAIKPIPDEFYTYEVAIEIVEKKRRWILCPSNKSEQTAWLEALTPFIGGENATEAQGQDAVAAAQMRPPTVVGHRRSIGAGTGGGGAGGRARGISMVTGGGTGKRGWLEKQEDEGGEWLKRYFVLERRTRDGAHEASMEYYMDESLAADEDAETIYLGKAASITPLSGGADGGRSHAAQLTSENGTMYVLSASSAAELKTWIIAIEEACKGTFLSDVAASASSAGSAATPSSSSSTSAGAAAAPPASKLAPVADNSSMRLQSGRSEGSASMAGGAIPDVGMRLHAGWMQKKGDGMFAGVAKRYFVLYRTGEVHYFDKEWGTDAEMAKIVAAKGHKGAINLTGVKPSDIVRTDPNSAKSFAFTIATPKRKWQLTAASAADFDEWKAKISAIL